MRSPLSRSTSRAPQHRIDVGLLTGPGQFDIQRRMRTVMIDLVQAFLSGRA
jgi:hypothetical protein